MLVHIIWPNVWAGLFCWWAIYISLSFGRFHQSEAQHFFSFSFFVEAFRQKLDWFRSLCHNAWRATRSHSFANTICNGDICLFCKFQAPCLESHFRIKAKSVCFMYFVEQDCIKEYKHLVDLWKPFSLTLFLPRIILAFCKPSLN